MKNLLLVLLAFFAGSGTVVAQGCDDNSSYLAVRPPGLTPFSDFKVRGCIDAPAQFQMVPRAQPLVVGLWAFECRSGLQPSTQRVGDVAVRLVNANSGKEYLPATVRMTSGPRPDVATFFRAECPALGDQAGASITLTGLPPAGIYRMEVLIDTFDYAGRAVYLTLKRTFYLVDF